MEVGQFAARLGISLIGAAALVAFPAGAFAQDGHSASMHRSSTPEDKARTSALVQAVREATERYKDPAAALQDGYAPMFGCVTGSSEGAMGIHFVNGSLLDGRLDPAHPEILLYEPLPDGSLKLTGADFLVLAATWNASNPAPPELMGQLLHFFESPNRFGLPEFFTLHVWAWKENPQGTFANWNPNVSCDAYNPQNPVR